MRLVLRSTWSSAFSFQSTHPVWDATGQAYILPYSNKFQSTHPVWDATYGKGADADILKFQSTHPVWDATAIIVDRHHGRRISIHASRMGCDCSTIPCSTMPAYFNPRIPYGMRPPSVPFSPCGPLFQSTHPVWDATLFRKIVGCRFVISIHASRMGCDHLDRR